MQRSPRFIIRYAATGESMPPDISATARPLIPTGSPPCPGCPPVKTNTSCCVDLDEDLRVRVLERHRQPVRGLDLRADQRVQLLGGNREPLVAAPRPDGERAAVRPGQRDRGRDRRLGRLVHAQRTADPDDPRHVDGPRGHPVHRRRVLRLGQAVARHPQHQHPFAQHEFGAHPGAAHRRAQVRLQHALELLPVASLKEDLALLKQYARLACDQPRRPGGGDWIGHGHRPSLPVPQPFRLPRLRPVRRKAGKYGAYRTEAAYPGRRRDTVSAGWPAGRRERCRGTSRARCHRGPSPG